MLSRSHEHNHFTPLVRRNPEDVVVQEVYDELVIYDLKTNEAHSLNSTAAKVWRLSDGEFTTEMMTQHLMDELQISHEQAESLVWLSLDRFEKANLLQGNLERPAAFMGITRRQVLKGIAIAAIIPVVYSITAPTASAQLSRPLEDLCIKKSEYDKDPTICDTFGAREGACWDNAGCGVGNVIPGYYTCFECLDGQGPDGATGTTAWQPFVI